MLPTYLFGDWSFGARPGLFSRNILFLVYGWSVRGANLGLLASLKDLARFSGDFRRHRKLKHFSHRDSNPGAYDGPLVRPTPPQYQMPAKCPHPIPKNTSTTTKMYFLVASVAWLTELVISH